MQILVLATEDKRTLHTEILPTLSKFLREKGQLTNKTIESVIYDALRELMNQKGGPEIITTVDGISKPYYTFSYDDIYEQVKNDMQGEDVAGQQAFYSLEHGK